MQPETAAAPPLIEGRGLSHHYDIGRVDALRGVDVAIAPGEFVAIEGPSGCGKSSLLHMLGALDTPTRGTVLFRGEPLGPTTDLARFRAKSVGFVFQDAHLLPTLSAIENVQAPMLEMPWRSLERRRRAGALLDAVGLSERAAHRPAHLSGGERQRVALARSLANEPVLLLADEPTGNLDRANADRVMSLLAAIHAGRRMTLVVVTHDRRVAERAGRILQMVDGAIVR